MTRQRPSSDEDGRPSLAERMAEWMEFALEIVFTVSLLAAVWIRPVQFIETAIVAFLLIRLGRQFDYERSMIKESAWMAATMVAAAFDRVPVNSNRMREGGAPARWSWSAGIYFRRRWAIIKASRLIRRNG